jgi:hypothetical protein
MELTMATRKEITKAQADRYRDGSRAEKSSILDKLCEVTGYHRDYASRALRAALTPRAPAPRAPRAPKYGPQVVAALRKCWAVLNAPAGKRLAPMLAELVPLLRHHRELEIDDEAAALVIGMSAATIDRRLVAAKSKLLPRGRCHTKPGSMLKSRIQMRTWAEHDEDAPGFVEVDLVGHEGGNPAGRFCFTLTVTDIATGWTDTRTVIGKAQAQVLTALSDVVEHLPFPVKGIDSDNGSEFINEQLFGYCHDKGLRFTRSRSGNSNDGAHVEQKNWTMVRQLVGYLRYDTAAEQTLLNQIWVLQSLLGNHFYPQQKLVGKVRDGAKVTKRYDTAATPYARIGAHEQVDEPVKRSLAVEHASFNPAAVQRQIQDLCAQLLTLATSKSQSPAKPTIAGPAGPAVPTGPAGADRPAPRQQQQPSPKTPPTPNTTTAPVKPPAKPTIAGPAGPAVPTGPAGADRPAPRQRQRPSPKTPPTPNTTTAPVTPPAKSPTPASASGPCPVCATPFAPVRRQRYCSPACRQAAWRARRPAPVPPVVVPSRTPRREITVYQCSECDSRYLGQQWCHDCNRPCVRLDFGGPCPHCDEPVAVTDIIEHCT